jgi:hypothetical protein
VDVPLTIKIGGHLFAKGEVDVQQLKAIADVIKECHEGSDRWAVVVGGGELQGSTSMLRGGLEPTRRGATR